MPQFVKQDSAYPKKIAVTEKQLAAVNLKGDEFHPEWNYTISPTPTAPTHHVEDLQALTPFSR